MIVPVKIPPHVDILIEKGQRVNFSTPLLKRRGEKTVKVPLSQLMKFQPDKIFLRLKKAIGEPIKKGDLVAEQKNLLSTKRYFSEIDGILREIDHIAGSLTIEQENADQATHMCYFTGEIAAIYDDYLELSVEKSYKAQTTQDIPYLGAEIFYATPDTHALSEENINGKCIFATDIPAVDHTKIEALGGTGLIIKKPMTTHTAVRQIVLAREEDFDHVQEHQYAFCIVGPEPQTLYFYE